MRKKECQNFNTLMFKRFDVGFEIELPLVEL